MAKIKAGTYRFNDVLTATDVELNANLNFTVEVSAYGMYEGVAHCDNITVTAEMHNPDMPYRYWYNTMHYNVVDLVPPFEYLSTPVELLMYQTTYYDGEISGIWETDTYSEGIKTITVPYDQDVSDEFEPWFTANTKRLSTITYNGSTIATLNGGQTATLKCKGMKMESDIVVEVPESGGGSGGGAEMNIAYGDTEPTDTSKLWVKTNTPDAVNVTSRIVTSGGEMELAIAGLPRRASAITSAAVGTKVYLFGGLDGSQLNTINVFDTENNTINTLSITLPSAASAIASAAVGTKVYLFGGKDDSSYLSTINVFDTETNTITMLSTTLPYRLSGIASAAVGTKVYLFGGEYSTSYYSIISVFDTETNTITMLSTTLPQGASTIASAAVGTKVYLFGGGNKSSRFSTINVFDTENNTITTLSATLPTVASFITSAAVGTKVYLFGGFNGSRLNTINVFDTENNTITTLSITLPSAASAIASAAVGTKVYLFGGYANSAIQEINAFVTSMPLTANNLLIETNVAKNLFNLLPNVEMGVNSVYLGNADGNAEKVAAALYRNGAWVEI